ncbi:double-strand break repair protein AddB [Rhodobacteraceae bacterium WD3A24]|nr:double-strand break repair protein AddB [Rhodobacteraceae bacterium WD3A24]
MFEDTGQPRLFALPPGAAFPEAVAAGLRERLRAAPPEAMARVELFVNTRHMRERLRGAFAARGALLLPRIRLVTELATDEPVAELPLPVPPLRRRLELTQLVAGLLEREPDLAPRSAIYDMADSLAALMDEMQGEGVGPDVLEELDVSEHSRHWARSLAFLRLVERYFGPAAAEAPDIEARQRLVVEHLAARWAARPPAHPVIVAGSTGSRGATAQLMEAVARLPQGALILPGFDFDMPAGVWAGMDDALSAEDHPQYRFRALLDRLEAEACAVRPWHDAPAPAPARNRVISLALRPAPVTDQWREEGRAMRDLEAAMAGASLIEAPSPRAEAQAIALCLRNAAADGRRAALVTPDRILSRQVTAALDRWGIVPDDSAGRPLALSAPGRLLRHVAGLFGQRLSAAALIVLLKHPLTHSGAERGEHLRHTRDLELALRRDGPPYVGPDDLTSWARERGGAGAEDWAAWLGARIEGLDAVGPRPLERHARAHLALAEALAAGTDSGTGSGGLWAEAAGEQARAAMEELAREAEHGGVLPPADYADLFAAVLQRHDIREAVRAHPHVMIRGTREAREQGADLVILAGLNEGVWPRTPEPDPWLNRQMRHAAGLRLPERQIGLSAHDFQQAAGAGEVVLSRAVRDGEAETVPARWLNRLVNLLGGLAPQGGAAALEAMRARGRRWLDDAAAIEADYTPRPAAPRPAPRPPVRARPRELPVTAISRLIRDPYAIYARYVLRLRPLDALHKGPDALLRGEVLHKVFEHFMRDGGADAPDPRAALMATGDSVLAERVPWPMARAVWRARLGRVAGWFLAREAERATRPVLLETPGKVPVEGLDFTLTARPDRIDADAAGNLVIFDYKTGKPPSEKVQEHFDRQLPLEAAMAARGAFPRLGPRRVVGICHIGLGAKPQEAFREMTPETCAQSWAELATLITNYMRREQGYAARRAVAAARYTGDYDHLARYGEWDTSTPPAPEDVG